MPSTHYFGSTLTRFCHINAGGGQADQTISTGTATEVSFDQVVSDPDNLADIDNNRIVVDISGDYILTVSLYWNATDGQFYSGAVYLNGGLEQWLGGMVPGGTLGLRPMDTCPFRLTANDAITIYAWQDSGGDETLRSHDNTFMRLVKVG